jgi:hypothetical protein
MSWHSYWMEVRRQVEADPKLQRLRARMEDKRASGGVGSPAYKRAERAYLAFRKVVEDQARQDVSAAEVDREREDKAAYMRDYRASKRAVREAVDARRAPPAGQTRS